MICFVLGSARCVWDDYVVASSKYKEFDIMAINDIGMHIPFEVNIS